MSDDARTGSGELGPVARRLAASQRVLAVEDETDIAHFLRAYFRASGFDFVHVDPASPDEAVAAITRHEPDLVLLDLMLSGFRGETVYRMLRADERFALTPILIVSATDFDGGAPGGLDGYVSKPFNTDLLADTVKEHLARADRLAGPAVRSDIGAMSEKYLRTRLVDEINAGNQYDASFTFAIVQLRTLDQVVADLGNDGATAFLRTLVADVRSALPDDLVIGLTGPAELAAILPGVPANDGARLVGSVLERLSRVHEMAGGAQIPVELVAGVGGFPDHASDPDELYMVADAAVVDASPDQRVVVGI